MSVERSEHVLIAYLVANPSLAPQEPYISSALVRSQQRQFARTIPMLRADLFMASLSGLVS